MLHRVIAFIAGIALVSPSLVVGQTPSVCERLAGQLGLHKKTAPARYGENVPEWRRDMVGGLKGALLGGSAVTTLKLESVDDYYTPDELDEQCEAAVIGAECELKGPVVLHVRSKDREASVQLDEGEEAVFIVRNTKLICRDVPASDAGLARS
jgi:ferric-dicitrate binding protein FerR (iron transport regulator)